MGWLPQRHRLGRASSRSATAMMLAGKRRTVSTPNRRPGMYASRKSDTARGPWFDSRQAKPNSRGTTVTTAAAQMANTGR